MGILNTGCPKKSIHSLIINRTKGLLLKSQNFFHVDRKTSKLKF